MIAKAASTSRSAWRSRRNVRRWLRLAEGLLLLAILAAGAALRFYDLNWDEYQHVHPDERFIVWVADTMYWPEDPAAVLDPARSPLSPFRWPEGTGGGYDGKERNYAYGHFPLYLLVGTAHAGQALAEWLGRTKLAFPPFVQPLHTVGRHLTEYSYLPLVGRSISALADLGTLLLVYALARRLCGLRRSQERDIVPAAEPAPVPVHDRAGAISRWIPLLAAGAYAFSVLPIQLSHFSAVDPLLTFCATAAVTLAVGAVHPQRGFRWLRWIAAGAMAGLAVGSKFSAILLAVPLAVAALYGIRDGSPARKAGRLAARLAAAAATAVLTFAITNPFAVLQFEAYMGQIVAQNAMVTGAADLPYTRQYEGTAPYWYFIHQLSQWGLGWPLGVVAWGGLAWSLVQLVRRRARPVLVVMLAWAIPYFATTGVFHAKFIRYMAPLLPFLLVFGAGLGQDAYRWLAARWRGRGRLAWATVTGLVALATVGWALAFGAVYRQEHPWIQASRWIYENVPTGAKILNEHWDDSLPLSLDKVSGRPASRRYRSVDLPLYDRDTPEKLEVLVEELSSADYLVLASNRLYAPIQRLAWRYPMSSQYYRMLFAGELGYEEVAAFSAYPSLLGVTIRDDGADESFTVYDHPRPRIFQNVGRLSPEVLRSRLERYLPLDSGRLPRRLPGKALYAAAGSREAGGPEAGSGSDALLLAQPVDTLPVVADFRWNRAASAFPPLAAFLWWLVLSIAGWAAWPLLFPLFGRFRDRGYGLARTAGWLLIGWLHWLGVSLGLWQNRVGAIAAVSAAVIAAGLAAGWLQRRRLADFWRTAAGRRWLVAVEGLFLAAFLAFVGLRVLNPDLWQPWNGGEKFMEFAFLNAILRSARFPPYDPYFAGGIINYYYYGLYLVSLPVKLTGIVPEVAFNLAVPGVYALTAAGAFSVGLNLAPRPVQPHDDPMGDPAASGGRPLPTAALSVLLTLVAGNLHGLRWLAENLGPVLRGERLPFYDYWAASRVIPFTINEFPLWTFVFADLHPHMISMPFGMLVVGAALHWLLAREQAGIQEDPARRWPAGLLLLLLLALGLGAVGAINTWDLPTYSLLVVAALSLAGWRAGRLRGLAAGVCAAVAAVGLAIAAFLPFHLHYQPRLGGGSGEGLARLIGISPRGSPLAQWLEVWGFFLFLAAGYLMVKARARGPVAATEHTLEPAPEAGPAGGPLPLDSDAAAPEGSPAEDHEKAEIDDGIEASPGRQSGDSRPAVRARLIGALALLGAVAVLAAVGRPTFALAALAACLAALLALRRHALPQEAFVALLLALGLGVIGAIEVFYLRDFLDGGEWSRMNTLFKFSVPAWLLLGLAGGAMLPTAWRAAAALWRMPRREPGPTSEPAGAEGAAGADVEQHRGNVRPVALMAAAAWQAGIAVLLGCTLVFAAVGVPARVRDRFPSGSPPIGTLDGTAYMTAGRYTWPTAGYLIDLADEHDAIHWLLDHVTGTPVLAEAPAAAYEVGGEPVGYDYYRAGGLRASSLTGLPTFVGQHQYEQRPGEQVGPRIEQGKAFFETTDIAAARALIRELGIGYVYVGRLEQILFGADGLRKFEVMAALGDLEIVYRNPSVVIYRVRS